MRLTQGIMIILLLTVVVFVSGCVNLAILGEWHKYEIGDSRGITFNIDGTGTLSVDHGFGDGGSTVVFQYAILTNNTMRFKLNQPLDFRFNNITSEWQVIEYSIKDGELILDGTAYERKRT